MASTTFVNRQTPIIAEWLNDVNGYVYGNNFIAAGTGAVATTMQTKLRESVSVNDFWSGSGDATAAVNAALVAASEVKFLGGQTYNLTGDVTIPANRKIIVEKGAIVINTGGRFTAYDVDNVHWKIDGWVKSVAMATAPAKTGWPAIADGYFGNERGFIEFGSASKTTPKVGFTVTGSGIVSGDWTGTAAAATSDDVNKKGIAAFTASNVLVDVREVYGFRGEAVYAWGETANCRSISFVGIFSHDNKFNNLNFNVVGPSTGLVIERCLTVNGYAGIEMSSGEARNNYILNPLLLGIWFGVGAGTGPISVIGNTVKGSGNLSYYLAFGGSAVGPVHIEDNLSINPAAGAYNFGYCTQFTSKNNVSIGHSQTTAAYAFGYVSCTDGVIDGNATVSPGGFSSGDRFIDTTTVPVCSDLSVGVDHVSTNSTAAPDYWYREGTFTPSHAGTLTVVGSVALAGRYTKIGRVVRWSITISPVAAGTSQSTVSTTVFTGLPYTPGNVATCHAATGAIAMAQNGFVSTASQVWAPTWGATNAVVVVDGTYEV